jgi:hypothetical protein
MNTFTNDLKNNLIEKKLTESSINLYLRNLKKLNNNEDFKNFNFLKKPEEILNKLENLKDNTKRQYLISVVSVLNTYGDKYKNLRDKYYKLLKSLTSEINKTPTTEKTETQNKNWISWDEVLEIQNNLKESLNNLKKKNITEAQYMNLLKYVILSLYTEIPPRRNLDWLKMLITFNSDTADEKYNYLDLNKKQFIFNIYKTQKKGQVIVDIPEKLMEIINLYLKYHPNITFKKNNISNKDNIAFLVYNSGLALNKVNSITRILNKIFNKNVSSSMLRHIYLSNKYGDVLKEQQKDAELMSHNLNTQKDYIKE